MQKHTGLDFTYGFKTRQFVGIAKVPNLSHYTMVLNLQRVTENDNMILLQNEVFFYHEVTWRRNSTTTKWRLDLSSNYLKGTPHHYKMKISFYMILLYITILCYLKGTLEQYKMTIGKDMCFTAGSACSHHLLHITRLIFPCHKMRLGF